MTETVKLSQISLVPKGAVYQLKITRPESANALNAQVVTEMTSHLRRLANSPECRAVIVSGEGKNFCAGADLNWMKGASNLSPQANEKEGEALFNMFDELSRFPAPTVGLIRGAAFGGGVGLACCCDWTIAEESARFSLSEARLGLAAAIISPFLHARLPSSTLRRLVLTGDIFSAQEAREAGVVQKIVAASELKSALEKDLSLILKGAPEAQKAFKRTHLALERPDWDRIKAKVVALFAEARVSPSASQGIESFFAKENPPWSASLPSDWKV